MPNGEQQLWRVRWTALRSGAIIAIATGLMNVLNYGYTIVTAHVVGTAAFGAFSALMGALLVLNVLSLGLQATAARRISTAPDQAAVLERLMLAVGVRCAVALGVACVALAPLIDIGLHLESTGTAVMLGLTAVPLTYMGVQAGVLQGERRWRSLAALYVAQGLGRVLFGVGLMAVTPTAFWAMVGVALGAWLPVLVGRVALGRPRVVAALTAAAPPTWDMLREVGHSSQALLAFFALSNVDILVARASLSETQAGLYAGGLIMAKAVLVLPQFIVVLAFPAMSARHSARYALLLGLAVSLAIGVASTVTVVLLPDLATLFIGGDDYAAVSGDLWLFAVAGTVLAMVQLLVYSSLANRQRRVVWLIWLALAGVATGALVAGSATSLVGVVIVIDGALFLALLGSTMCGFDRRGVNPQPVG